MGSGTTFDIVFFTLIGIYFVGGMVIRKFLRGAEGYEMIPHNEFWADLPFLIRVSTNQVIIT